jgi:SHS2 domain-containing protein
MDHTADGKFRAFGRTLGEAFANAALACASLMWDWEKVERLVEHRVEVRGRDLEQLLYKFLEEMLFLLETKNFVLGGVKDLRIEEPEARADAPDGGPGAENRGQSESGRFSPEEGKAEEDKRRGGEAAVVAVGGRESSPESGGSDSSGFRLTARLLGDNELSRYDLHGDVKAVTYNEMKIERCDRWSVQVVVDM